MDAPGAVLAYVREGEETRFLVALNLGPEPAALDFGGAGEVAVSTHLEREGKPVRGRVELRGDEGVVVRLAA